jgi:predicted lipoprotein with Yx(FWY)xxD motif
MVRLLTILGICAALGLGLAACGDDDDDASATEAATTTTTEAASESSGATGGSGEEAKSGDRNGQGGGESKQGVEITTADSQFGEALFDGDRRPIYYFDKEQTESSECYGDCAVAWPPVLTDGDSQASGGVDATLLGTTERDDGSTQVTYAGRPLYHYVDDPPGQILCHDVVEFGGTWLAVQPNGDPVS